MIPLPGPYLLANGVHTYFEVQGQGPPVLLLHGGLDTIEPFRESLLPALARDNRVVLPERRGHGRTGDLPGPITHDLMAVDTIAVTSPFAGYRVSEDKKGEGLSALPLT